MDYSQSIANVAAIKDSIRLYKEETSVFFDFYDTSSFQIIFVENAQDLRKLCAPKDELNLPLAIISIDISGEEMLHYCDQILKLDYNLTLEHTTLFNMRTDFSKPENMTKLLVQLKSLGVALKK